MADIKDSKRKKGYSSNLEAMSCQSESEVSSDSAGETDFGERGAAEELSVSAEGTTNLVSGLLSEGLYLGNM